jgi:carboxypeptidase family protein
LTASHCHCAHRVTAFWAIGAVAALLSLAGCRRGVPVLDTSPRPIQADGTISGRVRGPAGTSPIDGRTVEVINVTTGERERTATNNAGGFTFKLKPGKYRVELTLRDGEMLVRQPGVITVNRSDVDADADFVVGTSGVVRPRYHAPRADDGLGSAVA